MVAKLKQILQFPRFADLDKARTAKILQIFLEVLLSIFGLHLLLELVGVFTRNPIDFIIEGTMVIVLLGLLAANRLGYTYIASFIFITLIWTAFTLFSFTNRGLRGTAVIAYLAILATASLLLGWRTVIGFMALCIIAVWGMAYAEETGQLTPILDVPISVAIEINFILVWSTVALVIATTGLRTALQRARQSEQSLLERNKELENIQVSLEEQVATRTRKLTVVAALGEKLNAILDVDQMLAQLTQQVYENFGYYHVHAFLIDEVHQQLISAAGSGTVGQQITAQAFTIPLNAYPSLIAQAARNHQVVLIPDVRQAPGWLDSPMFPETKAEAVVPIILEGRVVGIIDVLSDRVGGLDEGDVEMLRSLANLAAIAIHNAQLFTQVEASLAQTQAAQERYVAQSWQVRGGATQRGRVQRQGTPELAETLTEQLHQTAAAQARPAVVDLDAAHQAIVSPIMLQNQVIGTMQFYDSGQHGQWDEQQLALVQAIAGQVAQSAENLRLFDETRQRASREATIREITDKLRAAPNIDSLLETAAHELGGRLGVWRARLKLGIEPELDPGRKNGQ